MTRKTALLAVVASSACFATLAVLARLAYLEGARPLPLLTWRFAIAAVLMGGFLAVRRPGQLRAALPDAPRIAALSLTGYGAASISFFFALQHASAAVVTVLLYAYPALVAIAEALLRKERVGAARWAAVALTFAGCALAAGLFDAGVRTDPAGVALGLGSAVGYASFTLLSARVVEGRPRLVVMAYTFAFSALGIGLITVLSGESLRLGDGSPSLWPLLGLIVVIPTFLAVLLFLSGVRAIGPARAALASTTEPVFTIALAALLLDERLAAAQLVGAALVVAGIVLSERPSRWRTDPAVV